MDAVTEVGLTVFTDLFCARTDAYVYDSRAHIGEPLTPNVLAQAIIDKHAVSGYTARLTDDGRCLTHVGAIDFDHTPDGTPDKVRSTMTALGLPSLLCHSRRGAHLWVVAGVGDGTHGSEEHGDIPASSMRKALTHAIRLTDAELLHGVEVFPKESASPWGVGALRLPLMTHPKTGMRYPCVDMDGNRLTKLVDIVQSMKFAEWSVIQKLANDAPVEYPRHLGEYRKQVDRRDVPKAVTLLAALGVEAQPGRSCRCPFHDDKKASLSVADDEERIWCKAPECPAYNGGRGIGTLALARMIQTRKAP
jgi:hypothetical protein